MNSNRKKVVVVGSGGRLGQALMESLAADHEVLGLDRKALDLGSVAAVDAGLGALEYDELILTGALTAVDYCETHRAEAFAVNAAGPGRIAEISADKGAHVTYVSTDMVFDGLKSGLCKESDEPNPSNVYGESKFEGERLVLKASPDHLVARVSWVFGPARPAFPDWIIGKARTETDLTLPDDKYGCPTYTPDLAGWLRALSVDAADRPASGVYHLCNSGSCAWRDWGQACIDFARDAGFPMLAGKIRGVRTASVTAFVAKRALNTAMDSSKFTAFTGIQPRTWQEALREFVMQSPTLSPYKLSPQST